MKHNLIKTDNYLLVVDNNLEIKEGDKVLYNDLDILTTDKFDSWFTKWDFVEKSIPPVKYINNCKKIIAHLPLKGTPVLEDVPLLPSLPKEDDVDYWIHETVSSLKDEHTIKTSSICLKAGYNKAKEKYKYTEEDVIKIVEKSRETGLTAEYLILSLQHHPKYPIAFECEVITRVYDVYPQRTERKPKTITNPQGGTEWVGKYVWE